MVKIIIPALLICLATVSGEVFASDSITVHVTTEGFKSEDGICRLLLFKSKKGFPDSRKDAELVINRNISGKKAEFSFKVMSGKYAISILHDENLNEKMDKTWFGKPKEGFGASNNPKVRRSPPEFEESVVILDENNKYLTINLNYL